MSELPDLVSVELPPDHAWSETALRDAVAQKLQVPAETLPTLQLRQRSLDARRRQVRYRLQVALLSQPEPPLGGPAPQKVQGKPVIIVGGGPAGLFCAYELARAGIASVVVERGKPVQPRRHDLKGLQQHGRVDPDSNYCFGEGGAGTYSDGKLYTRATKRGDVRDIIEVLAMHGAPADILVNTRPHIGSNRLPKVVTQLREKLSAVGVRFEFGRRVVDLLQAGEHARAPVHGVRFADGDTLEGAAVVLATGHSARDVFEWLVLRHKVQAEAKPFAMGVRIEHPQPFVNAVQYGEHAGHAALPNAAYRLAASTPKGDVFSFCMCPGGFVVPACTDDTGLVVNGMSLSRRDSPYANSGLVCAVGPEDWEPLGFEGPLAGVALQQRLEGLALAAGDRQRLAAPATRVTDFMQGHASTTTPPSSYIPGLVPCNVAEVLDGVGLPLANRLRTALRLFDRQMKGYIMAEAVMIGVESRTSSPLRIARDRSTLEASLPGLYPCGEGAGYAGGIISAALDGVRVAQQLRTAL